MVMHKELDNSYTQKNTYIISYEATVSHYFMHKEAKTFAL